MHFNFQKWNYIFEIGVSFTLWKPFGHYVRPNSDTENLSEYWLFKLI